MSRRFALLVASLLTFCGMAAGQTNFCASHATSLYCLSSDLYNSPTPDPFSPIMSAVGAQLTLVPLASPASGIVFKINPEVGKVATTGTFGPVLTERGESIGKGKILVAMTYQRFSFSSMDGINLNRVPVVFDVCFTTGGCSLNGSSTKIDLRINQFAIFSTVGITNRLEVSVAIPVNNVRMSVTGQALGPFLSGAPVNKYRWATGVGDVVIRGKYTIASGERFNMAAGVDVRAPSGDALNFLGSGAPGVRAFAALSRSGRVSPHANFGYQWNGTSVLGGTVSGQSDSLPSSVSYYGGADFGVFPKLTVVADYLGDYVINANRFHEITDPTTGFPTVEIARGSFNTARGAFGLKISPVHGLLITGNVLLKFEHNGLRNNPVPLVGISYTF